MLQAGARNAKSECGMSSRMRLRPDEPVCSSGDPPHQLVWLTSFPLAGCCFTSRCVAGSGTS